jgi:hypothetical protein
MSLERYVSFENIDCFENACKVLDAFFALLKEKPEANNEFWKKFIPKVPANYYSRTPDEDVLYLVCSNVFYLEELFEEFDFKMGLDALQKAEFECC